MTSIIPFILGELQTNCYLIISSNKACLIDPADDFEFLSHELIVRGLQLKYILLTHGHFDHCLAAFALQKIYNVPLYINFKDNFILKKIESSVKYWLHHSNEPYFTPLPTVDLAKVSKLKLNDVYIQIIQTPGHTPGSTSFYIPTQNTIFTGDIIFSDGIGRSDFSYSSKKNLNKSIETLKHLPVNTLISPGHGLSFPLSNLL